VSISTTASSFSTSRAKAKRAFKASLFKGEKRSWCQWFLPSLTMVATATGVRSRAVAGATSAAPEWFLEL